jgi:hypothetical protein
MLKAKDFRRIALGMDNAIESAHMGHPDFRVNGRIFATLHHDDQFGMVGLTPDQQQTFVERDPASFAPENGAWGRGGSTRVRLDSVDEETLGEAMTFAWQNAIAKSASGRSRSKSSRGATRTTRRHASATPRRPSGKRS